MCALLYAAEICAWWSCWDLLVWGHCPSQRLFEQELHFFNFSGLLLSFNCYDSYGVLITSYHLKTNISTSNCAIYEFQQEI